jgi:hypothetical protein
MRPLSIPRTALPLAATPLIALFFGCSGSPGTTGSDTSFPESALQVMTCDPGTLQIEIRTAPVQPPTAGLDGIELVLTDPKSSRPIEGAKVSLVPWMPLMGHGSDVTPSCDDEGKGRIVCTNVNLYMPGEWQLRFAISAAGTRCSAAPTYDVP